MRNCRHILFTLLFLPALTSLLGQESPFLDSLLNELPSATADTHKVILLNDIAWELKFEDPQKAREYLDSALALAQDLNYKTGEGNANNYRGVVEDIHGNSELAIQYFEKALKIREESGDKFGVARLYNNIGNVHDNLGNRDSSLVNYLRARELYSELGDSARVARASYNLAILYENVGNFQAAQDYILEYFNHAEKTGDSTGMANAYNVQGNIRTEKDDKYRALENYRKALRLHRIQGNEWESSTALNNLGHTFDEIGEDLMDEEEFDSVQYYFDNALGYYFEALGIRKSLEDLDGEGETYNNIGVLYKNYGSYYSKTNRNEQADLFWEKALTYLDTALQIRNELGDQLGIVEVWNGLGDVYRRQGKLRQALQFTEQYLALAEELNNEKFIQNGYKDLARLHYRPGSYKLAYDWFEKYDKLKSKRYNQDRLREFEQREVYYSDLKKQEENQKKLILRDAKLKQAAIFRNSLIVGAIGLILLIALLWNRYRIKAKSNLELEAKNEIIEAERERSDALLLNILPEQTAKELKEKGKAAAKKYDSVTVLFTDFESFTKIAEATSPEELVAELDECFRAFDEIITRNKIEKIKTIGDAYMCAGGLPTENQTHPQDVINAAMEMRDFMTHFAEKQRKKGRPEFRTRFGIHSGPVVAGVVGSKKFAYDIWGDTVNLAARMEEKSEPGKINISKDTYNLVKDQFEFESRGKLTAKNKGAVEMYFIERKL